MRGKYVPKHVIEGNVERRKEMAGRRGRRRRQLLDGLKEKGKYWILKEEASDHTLRRIRFVRTYGSVVRLTRERRNRNNTHSYKVFKNIKAL